MSNLYHLYEYDETLHESAKLYAELMTDPAVEFSMDAASNVNALHDLSNAYLDLLAKRGLPPKIKYEAMIQLESGNWYDFLNPDSTPLTPRDIASGLSKTSRCAGQTFGEYGVPVAQHCVLAAEQAPPGFKLEALMHDGIESVMGDCCTPLKQCLPDWKRVEQNCEHSLRRFYHLPLEMSHEVKLVDIRLAATEKRDLLANNPGDEWPMLEGIEGYVFTMTPWPAPVAKKRWLEAYQQLWSEPRASRPNPQTSDYISPRVFDGRQPLSAADLATLRNGI